MNAPLPQDLLDERNPSIMRPRNSKTSPVLKVHRSSAASAYTTSGAYATPGMGAFSPDDGDCDAYLTPDWILGGRMKDHLLLDNGNINNSAECLGAHGGTPNYESDRESVNKLKNKQKGRWMCPDSDTAFDPPINQDKNAYEVTNLLNKGELEVVAETSFIKPSPQNHLPKLDFSKLPKNPFQNSNSFQNSDKVQDLKTDDTLFKKSSAHQNSRTPQSSKPNKPIQHSAHDSVPNGTLSADRDDACCSNRTEDQTPDPEPQPNSPRGGDEQSPASFSPRILNRFRLPTFSRHSSFEVGAPQTQGPNTSPPNASLPMLNRMQSLPVSPNPYTMTALSSQPDLARSTPDTSSVVIGNGRSSSNVADRGGVIGAQSQVGREDGETNDAVV